MDTITGSWGRTRPESAWDACHHASVWGGGGTVERGYLDIWFFLGGVISNIWFFWWVRYLIFDFLGAVISDIWFFWGGGGLISDIWFFLGGLKSDIWSRSIPPCPRPPPPPPPRQSSPDDWSTEFNLSTKVHKNILKHYHIHLNLSSM